MKPHLITFMALIITSLLASCATLNAVFKEPEVSVVSFKLLPGNSLSPAFEIGLRVVNPNSIDLNVQGLAYTASIEGYELLSGVSNDLPSIPAYGEENIKLRAKVDLFGGLRLVTGLMKSADRPLTYQLKVKMNVGSFSLPIYITKEGKLSMPTLN